MTDSFLPGAAQVSLARKNECSEVTAAKWHLKRDEDYVAAYEQQLASAPPAEPVATP